MFEGWTSPFAQANQQTEDRNAAWNAIKNDPGSAALIAGLSMLSNNDGSRSFGQLVGRAGFDSLVGLGSMEAQRQAQERYQQEQDIALADAARKRQKDAFDMGMALNQYQLDRDKYQLDKQKQEAEMAAWDMLRGSMGGAPSVGSGGMSGAPTADVPIWKRNNNPGNLRNVGGDGFQSFPTIEDGVRGMGRQLDLYFNRDGLTTVRGMVSKYAPPNENQTDAYVAKVAKDLGVDPDAPLSWDPVTRSRLVSSMMHMETGQPWDARQVGDVLSGGVFPAPSGDNPLAPPVIPDSVKKKSENPFGTGMVPDDVPRISPIVGLLPGGAGQAGRWLYEQEQESRKNALDARKTDPAFIMAQENAKAVPAKVDALFNENSNLSESINNFEVLSSLYARGLEVMGLPDAAIQQQFENLVTQNVFDVLSQQKGVQTEGDAQRAAQTWASVKNLPEANLWIAQLQKNVAERQIAINNKTMELLEKHNGNMRLVNADIQKFKDSLPSIVPDDPRRQKKRIASDRLTAVPSHGSSAEVLDFYDIMNR